MKLYRGVHILWTTGLLIALALLAGLALERASAAEPRQDELPPVVWLDVEAQPGDSTISDTFELPANPFPATPLMTDTVQAVAAALARGENLQSAQFPEITLLEETQGAAPAEWVFIHRAYLPLVLRGAPAPTPQRPNEPDKPDENKEAADVAVSIWPNPSVQVVRSGLIAYEMRVANVGAGESGAVEVRLPYTHGLIQVYGSNFPHKGDWVSEVNENAVTVKFAPVDAGERRKATIFFRVNGWLGDGTVLPMQASYEWSDADAGGEGKTNSAPLTVGAQEQRSAWGLFSVGPKAARSGASHTLYSDRLLPGEGVVYWLNMPNGAVRALDLTSEADDAGRTSVVFRSTDLPPGDYSLVGYGKRSEITIVGFFTVYL